MKKIFFSLLAIAAIASCAKTEAVYEGADSEIKLVPVTALQTKANVLAAIDGTEYPTAENFDVYGYWKNVGAGETYTDGQSYFGGAVEFTNKGNYWGGVTPYYWPKNGALRFAAYSPADLDIAHNQEGDTFSGAYTQPSKTNETWDFLVAPTSESYTAMTAAENVSIVFEHALSWITLQVKAKDEAAKNVFTIKSVKINGVNTTADFEASMLGQEMVQYESWTNWGTPAEYVVFDGVQGVTAEPTVIETTPAGTLVIPQTTTNVTVVFNQKGVNGTMDMTDMEVNLDLVLNQDNEPWRPGYHYIYTLVFGLDEILINPSVDIWNEYVVGELDPEAINVSTAAQLEAALANEDATKITFQADIAGQFNVPEVAGRTLTIDGNGYELNGSFTLIGNSSYTSATTLFQNINFVAADAADVAVDAFVWGGTLNGDTSTRYPDNVTIKNCTFTATGSAVETVVGAKFWSLKDNLVVEGCTANGLHSLMQLTSCGDATVAVEDVTVENCKNGISLQYAGKTTISNSNITAREYGVRADGCKANTSIVNTTIEAKQPVIVRKVTVDGYVLNVDDKTTLTTAEDYQVIFTAKSDDVAYVAPTASYTFNGPATLKVFPKPAAWVETAEELAAALTADKENIAVVLSADIDLPIASLGQQTGGSGEYKLGGESTKNITIDLGGKTLNITTTYWSGIGAKNADAKIVIKNGTMTSSQATGTWNSYDLTFANCNYEIANVEFSKAIAFTNANKTVVLNDVTINETHDYYAMWISAKGQDVKINGLTINSTGRGIKIDEQYVGAPAKVTMKVENATFKTAKKAAILVKSAAGAAIALNNVDITATPDTVNAVWVDSDSAAYADKVTVTGGNVVVEE